MTFEQMVSRVAARSLRAEEQTQGPPADGQQAQQTQQALPQSGPGKMMVQKAYDALGEAIESGDDGAFDQAIENLVKAKGTRPNRA